MVVEVWKGYRKEDLSYHEIYRELVGARLLFTPPGLLNEKANQVVSKAIGQLRGLSVGLEDRMGLP